MFETIIAILIALGLARVLVGVATGDSNEQTTTTGHAPEQPAHPVEPTAGLEVTLKDDQSPTVAIAHEPPEGSRDGAPSAPVAVVVAVPMAIADAAVPLDLETVGAPGEPSIHPAPASPPEPDLSGAAAAVEPDVVAAVLVDSPSPTWSVSQVPAGLHQHVPTAEQIAAAIGAPVSSPDPERLIQTEVFLRPGAASRARALIRLVTAIALFGALLGGAVIGTARMIGLLLG